MEKALAFYLNVKSIALLIVSCALILYLLVCVVTIIKDYFDWR